MIMAIKRACRYRGVDPETGYAILIWDWKEWRSYAVRADRLGANVVADEGRRMGARMMIVTVKDALEGELVEVKP